MDKNILYRQDNKELYDKLLSIVIYQRINRVSFERYVVYREGVYFYNDINKCFEHKRYDDVKYDDVKYGIVYLLKILENERNKNI